MRPKESIGCSLLNSLKSPGGHEFGTIVGLLTCSTDLRAKRGNLPVNGILAAGGNMSGNSTMWSSDVRGRSAAIRGSFLGMGLCILRAVLCMGMLLPFCSALAAQEPGKPPSVVIEIADEQGGFVSYAQVQILPLPSAAQINLRAGWDGKISLDLSPGSYDARVSAPGFSPVTERIEVPNGTQQTIDIVLKVASCSPGACGDAIPIGDPLIVPSRLPLDRLSDFCDAQVAPTRLLPTDAVYSDATKLAHTLNDLGLPVRCTLTSKMQRIFKGQRGAAFYVVDDGSFEVLFLKKTESFARLEIIERQENYRYLYSFRGTPRTSVQMGGSRPSYFIKRGNMLFYVWGNEQLAAKLQARLAQ
jgi:hypothetical protein